MGTCLGGKTCAIRISSRRFLTRRRRVRGLLSGWQAQVVAWSLLVGTFGGEMGVRARPRIRESLLLGTADL